MYKLRKGSQCDLVKLLSSQNRDYLIRNNGDQVKIESLHGKNVGIYVVHLSKKDMLNRNYKATIRNMVEAYNQLRAVDGDFEIVLVAIQRWSTNTKKYKTHKGLFDRVFSTMPWLAIPHFDFEARMRFTKCKYCDGCLFIDKQGVVGITWGEEAFTRFGVEMYPFSNERAVELTMTDEKALEERTVRSFLSSPSRDYVISNTKEKVPISELEEKVVGLYFYRCTRASVQLLPKLIEVYNNLKYRGENFEVVMINLRFLKGYHDNEQLFEDEFKLMPWLALPYKDLSCRKLARMFDHYDHYGEYDDDPERDAMHNILVIVGPGGNIFDCNGGGVLCRYGIDAYPFTTKAVTEKKILTVEKTIPTLKACTLESVFDSLDIKFANAKCSKQVLISHLIGKSIMLFIGQYNHFWTHEFMENLLNHDHDFQVIYVSKDVDMQSFQNFISEMPRSRLTLPFDREKAQLLTDIFQVNGYSQGLVAFGPDGRFLTNKVTVPFKDCEIYNKHMPYFYLYDQVYGETKSEMLLIPARLLWDVNEVKKEDDHLTYLYPDDFLDLDFAIDGQIDSESNKNIDNTNAYGESSSDYESHDDKSDDFFDSLCFSEEYLLY